MIIVKNSQNAHRFLNKALLFCIFAFGVLAFNLGSVEASETEHKSEVGTEETVIAQAGPMVDPAIQAGLDSHKALYEVNILSSTSNAQVINLQGKMLYEWQSSCDAWISNHHFNLLYEYADSSPMRITSDFSTYENFDGETLDFTSQRKRDGELFEEMRGQVSFNEDGQKGGTAVYTVPDGLVYDLPPGTLLPMGHTLSVLKAIHKKQRFYTATVFDGSDGEGPVEINAFIGKAVSKDDVEKSVHFNANIDKSLLDSKAWKVRLAFFPLNKAKSVADYEMSMIFHENGVISDMVVEYENFSVSQKLVALEKLQPKCQDVQ